MRASDGIDEGDEEPTELTCNRCGESEGLSWLHTGVRWRLMGENGRFHVCKQIDAADDFDAV